MWYTGTTDYHTGTYSINPRAAEGFWPCWHLCAKLPQGGAFADHVSGEFIGSRQWAVQGGVAAHHDGGDLGGGEVVVGGELKGQGGGGRGEGGGGRRKEGG